MDHILHSTVLSNFYLCVLLCVTESILMLQETITRLSIIQQTWIEQLLRVNQGAKPVRNTKPSGTENFHPYNRGKYIQIIKK